MMKICNTYSSEFIWIANILFSKECQKEIGCQIYLYTNTNFLYDEFGFISYRLKDDIYLFDYDYILPQYRGYGKYKDLFKEREFICWGKLCKIETKNILLKQFLLKNSYEIIKINGSWTFFQKHL